MNYQYNQPPQAPQAYPQQRPAYTNEQKKSAFMTFSEKMAEFCNTNGILSPLARYSHIFTYILTGFSLIMGIILFFLKVNSVPLFAVMMFFAVLSLSKKTLLPFCIAISYGAGMYLVVTILDLVALCKVGGLGSYLIGSANSGVVGGVFNIIFMFIVIIVLAIIAVIAWMQFAAMLPPRMYQPQGYGQVPPQQGYGQVPPQQGGFQQAAPQQPPVQQAAPMQPQVPVGPKVCPACGMANDPDSGFCRGCGAKI